MNLNNHDDSRFPGSALGGLPEPDEIRRQLRRILGSPDFVASDRNRRFLAHVVERSLNAEVAKGYEIGTRVFGRPASFNATTDPIVRIEASKLRRDLETYYLKSGREDRVIIGLPKGVYRAVFSYRKELPLASAHVAPLGLSILRASVLGWAEQQAEAGAAWRALLTQHPGFLRDPRVCEALGGICGEDERLRDLLLEGLRRAAHPADLLPHEAAVFARGA